MSFDTLDDALVIEILQRLPDAKFANRLKLVCKNWNRVLSTPCFAHTFIDYHETCSKELKPFELIFLYLHKNILSEDPILETIWERKDPVFNSSKLDVSFPASWLRPEEPITSFRVVASCKELLLCESFDGGAVMYYICNPLTRSWVSVPPCPSKYDDYCYNILAGFVCFDRYYRVVRFIRSGYKDKALTVLIFSCETNKWKESTLLHPKNKSFQTCFSDVNSFALAWNGVLHWLMEDNKTVVAYKPYSPEECHFIDVPEEVQCDEPTMKSSVSLGGCKGSLQLLQLWIFPSTYNYYGGDAHTLRVWELKDYDTGEWRLKNKVHMKEMVTNERWLKLGILSNHMAGARVVALDPNDSDVVYLQYVCSASEEWIFCCDLMSNAIRSVCRITEQSRSRTNLLQLVLPPWPTAVPILCAHTTT